jgi:hypothetical protein
LGIIGISSWRQIGAAPSPMKPTPILSATSLHLAQMLVHLVAGLVDRFQWRAGQLQLSTGFERHVGAVQLQPDDVVALENGRPAEPSRSPSSIARIDLSPS